MLDSGEDKSAAGFIVTQPILQGGEDVRVFYQYLRVYGYVSIPQVLYLKYPESVINLNRIVS
jgi:hypothetical protein